MDQVFNDCPRTSSRPVGWILPIRLDRRFLKNPLPFTFNVFKLARPDGPCQQADHRESQQNRKRHEEKKDIHQTARGLRESRAAFNITIKELTAMPRPANQAGKEPLMASGTQTAL